MLGVPAAAVMGPYEGWGCRGPLWLLARGIENSHGQDGCSGAHRRSTRPAGVLQGPSKRGI